MTTVASRAACRERDLVVERAHHQLPDRGRGRARGRIEEAEPQAERDAGEAEHAAELTTAEDRDQLLRVPGHPVCLAHAPFERATKG